MASTYQDKNSAQLDKNNSAGTSSSLAKAIGSTVGKSATATSTGTAATGSTSTSGTNSYASKLNSLMGNSSLQYTPGDSVTSAQNYLNEVIANKPGSYESKYTSQLSSLYNQIMNRGQFSYNMNSDAMYQNYAQRYKQQGMQNLRDTYGQAAANTGGYGSSYAQTAGQQAYQNSIQSLAEQGASLQSTALNRYNDETTRLQNQYNTVSQADDTDYSRYADAYSRWSQEREYAAGRYDTAYSQDYNRYTTDLNTAQSLYAMEREDATNEQTNAQNQAMTYIQAGIMPSDSLLSQTGWDTESVRKLVKKYR